MLQETRCVSDSKSLAIAMALVLLEYFEVSGVLPGCDSSGRSITNPTDTRSHGGQGVQNEMRVVNQSQHPPLGLPKVLRKFQMRAPAGASQMNSRVSSRIGHSVASERTEGLEDTAQAT